LLADRGICVHYDVGEFQEDLKTLQEMGWWWPPWVTPRQSLTWQRLGVSTLYNNCTAQFLHQ
jgi:hypothetical protein